ncbi:hypothetical protein BMS3Abin04_03021 [bacterium BMS3Abin04]|nr:hypothetical protein BMS3Abin04_03021 [bacterium BMS3Abin04]
MSITKKYIKSKKNHKVTFIIPKKSSQEFERASVVGDFNKWDSHANEMKKIKKPENLKQ